MLKKLNWQAYTNKDRNKSIEEIKKTIDDNEGCILNFTMFSDLAMSLSIEIQEKYILQLHKALSDTLRITELDIATIRPNSPKEYILFLNVSFGAGSGNLKKVVPAVPG